MADERIVRFEEMLMDFESMEGVPVGSIQVKLADFADENSEDDYARPFNMVCDWKAGYKNRSLDTRIPYNSDDGRITLKYNHGSDDNGFRTCDCVNPVPDQTAKCVSRKLINFINNQLKEVLSQSSKQQLSIDVQKQGEEIRDLTSKVTSIENKQGTLQATTQKNIENINSEITKLNQRVESLQNQTKDQSNGANRWHNPPNQSTGYTDRRPPLEQAKCSANDIANALSKYDHDPVIATIRLVAIEHPAIIEDTINKMNYRLKERLFSEAMRHDTYGSLLRATNRAVKDYLNETAAEEIYDKFKHKSIVIRSELKIADKKAIGLMARKQLTAEINHELKKWNIREIIDEEDIDWGNVEDVTDTSVKIWISGKEMAEERINNKTLRCYALMIHNDAIQTKLIYKNVEDIMERRKRIDYDSRPKKVIETMSDPRQRPICHTCGIKGHTAMYCGKKKTR